MINNKKKFVGIDLDLGFIYAKVAVPIAWRIQKKQVYTSPSISFTPYPILGWPIGFSLPLSPTTNMHLESGMLVAYDLDDKFGLLGFGSFGISSRW